MPNRDPKNNYPKPGQQLSIGPLEQDELKSPNKNIGLGDAPYVNRDGGTISFESTGLKIGKGEVPNDVLARYRKAVVLAKDTGSPIPYLDYNGKKWYFQSRGKSLTNLETKLKVVADKTAREHAKTPTLSDYETVFGPETGADLYTKEQDALKDLTPGRKGTKTPKGYSRGHIRADGEGGRWHTRNLRLENTVRNAQQRQQKLTPEVERSLMIQGNTNQEFIATQGPRTTPRQTQQILDGQSLTRSAKTTRSLKRAATWVPLAGVIAGFGQAGMAASQGDYAGAAAHGVGALVGEIPIVGDVAVESVAGSPVTDGTLQSNLNRVNQSLRIGPKNTAAPTGDQNFDNTFQPLIKGLNGKSMLPKPDFKQTAISAFNTPR